MNDNRVIHWTQSLACEVGEHHHCGPIVRIGNVYYQCGCACHTWPTAPHTPTPQPLSSAGHLPGEEARGTAEVLGEGDQVVVADLEAPGQILGHGPVVDAGVAGDLSDRDPTELHRLAERSVVRELAAAFPRAEMAEIVSAHITERDGKGYDTGGRAGWYVRCALFIPLDSPLLHGADDTPAEVRGEEEAARPRTGLMEAWDAAVKAGEEEMIRKINEGMWD